MTCRDGKCHCRDNLASDEAQARFRQIQKELDAMDDRRELRKTKHGSPPPAEPEGRPSRDIYEAAKAVAQVAWYGLRTTAVVTLEMIVRMIRKGLGKKRSIK
jgi:hypothetical protein